MEKRAIVEQQGVQDSKALGVFQENQVFQDLQVCRVSPDMKDPSANQDSQDATGQREMLVTQGSLGLQVLAAFKVDQDCEVQRETLTFLQQLQILKEHRDPKDEKENMG